MKTSKDNNLIRIINTSNEHMANVQFKPLNANIHTMIYWKVCFCDLHSTVQYVWSPILTLQQTHVHIMNTYKYTM